MNESVRIDGERLWARLAALGEIGAVHGPSGERGSARLALTDADRDGRDLVVSWMHDLGLMVSVDAIGNVVAVRQGTDPSANPVMIGSHIDTVRTGGWFDGNLGVLGGLEVIETLEQHGIVTRRPLAVAFFTDEEGARFQPDMLGSLVYVGGMALEDALDVLASDDGARLGDELARIGYAGSVPCPAASAPHAYFELHIEQGPVLEDDEVTIGVVTGVQGISWTEVTITGQSAHAGTHVLSLEALFTPYGLPGGWPDSPEPRRWLELFAGLAQPGFLESIGEWRAMTPDRYEREFHLPHGHATSFAGGPLAALRNPNPELTRYETDVKGLYLTGAATFPGAGVWGASGRNAANTVLRRTA